jgi:polyhydroxybutyrate depolymerase
MKKLILLLLFSPVFVLGQQTINGTINHDNINREYILYVPASYVSSSPVPLVFCFHGYSSNMNANFAYTNFKAIADTAGFIVVHPQGTLDNTGTAHWNVGGWTVGSSVDDVGFALALLDSITSVYNIDSDRVYSTGMSNGGYMSFLLACQLNDRFTAVASVTGSMTPQTFNACSPVHPTPILQIHGTADATVPYAGNTGWTLSINNVLQYWAGHNNCNSSPTTNTVPDSNPNDGSTVEKIVYSGGDNGSSVEHFKITDGGHDWPGVWGNMDINASIEVWKFFSKYSLSELSAPVSFIENSSENLFCFPNPTNSLITIENQFNDPKTIEIINCLGTVVYSGYISKKNNQINVENLSPNIYFVQIETSLIKFLKL